LGVPWNSENDIQIIFFYNVNLKNQRTYAVFQLDIEIFRTIASFIKISSGHSLIIKEIGLQMSWDRCLAESLLWRFTSFLYSHWHLLFNSMLYIRIILIIYLVSMNNMWKHCRLNLVFFLLIWVIPHISMNI